MRAYRNSENCKEDQNKNTVEKRLEILKESCKQASDAVCQQHTTRWTNEKGNLMDKQADMSR